MSGKRCLCTVRICTEFLVNAAPAPSWGVVRRTTRSCSPRCRFTRQLMLSATTSDGADVNLDRVPFERKEFGLEILYLDRVSLTTVCLSNLVPPAAAAVKGGQVEGWSPIATCLSKRSNVPDWTPPPLCGATCEGGIALGRLIWHCAVSSSRRQVCARNGHTSTHSH